MGQAVAGVGEVLRQDHITRHEGVDRADSDRRGNDRLAVLHVHATDGSRLRIANETRARRGIPRQQAALDLLKASRRVGIAVGQARVIDAAVAADEVTLRIAMIGEVLVHLLNHEARVVERRAAGETRKVQRRQLVEVTAERTGVAGNGSAE